MAAIIKPVSFAGVLGAPNARELVAEYAAECSIPQIGAINPQADLYSQMEASGRFQVFGAFDGEELIGFAAVLVYLNPHYGRMIATVESLFLSSTNRSTTLGHGLMNAIEEYAEGKGCQAILYSARTGSSFARLLSLLKPYEHTNTVFLRQLQR